MPTISIDDIVQHTMSWGGVDIISSLTDGMDEWVVKFEKKRDTIRTILPTSDTTDTTNFNYNLWFDQTSITGWTYNRSHQIQFYMPNNDLLATLDKENWAITIEPKYTTRIQKTIDLTSNRPVILLHDSLGDNDIFTMRLNTKNPLLSSDSSYNVINLSWVVYWWFAWWTCILSKESECMVIASPAGSIVIPAPYNASLLWTYNYTDDKKTEIIFSDQIWWRVWKVSFNAFIK